MYNVAHKSLVMLHYVCMLLSKTDVSLFFSHLSSSCVSINPYNQFIISHTHNIQYNAI